MSEWISVKDRMPELRKNILCISLRSKEAFVNSIERDGYWFYDNGFITHWMPLPEPPKA